MGFAGGTVSFQRFHVTGRLPQSVDDAFVKALSLRTFGRLPPSSDSTQAGWIGPTHLFETEIAAERIAIGDFAHFALRIDKLKTPPAVLNSYIRQEEDITRQTTRHDVLSKFERKKAREAALTRAEQEARSGAFRRTNAYGVLIDLARRCVYCGGSGTAVADWLMAIFSDTFGCALEPESPERLGHRLMRAAKNARALENLPPARFVKPPDGYAAADGDGFGGAELDFLGKEFLTWLWFRTDRDDAPLRIASGGDVTVMIDKTLRLKCDFGMTGTTVISADHPSELPEARAALRTGKLPAKLGLVLGSALGEFRLTLDAARWLVSGLTLPEPEQRDEDHRARLEARFEQVSDVAALLDALYDAFLQVRVGREWNAEQRAIAKWIAAERESARVHAASA